MPEVVNLTSPYWTLTVWTKDIEAPLARLKKTLDNRGKALPSGSILFSPPIQIISSTATDPEALEIIHHPTPVFFENRSYEFEFLFSNRGSYEPSIIHHLKNIEDGFRMTGNSLRGSINFGNDVGWFRLGLKFFSSGYEIRQFFSFKVFPVKMDLEADLEEIHRIIDRTYPLWRFSFAKKTDIELEKSRRLHHDFPLLWMALFKSLQTELEAAVNLISQSPHSRLISFQHYKKPERLKGRIRRKTEEGIIENQLHDGRSQHYLSTYRNLSVDTPENRFVKMVLTQCMKKLSVFIRNARVRDAAPEGDKLSAYFYEEIEHWIQSLQRHLSAPLFAEVGRFSGFTRESLVLHHRAGYGKVYRIWQELKQYLDVFGRNASISVKSVAELYEVWCLLEIRRMIISLGFNQVDVREPVMFRKCLEKELRDGMGTAFRLERNDGITIRLAHEPLFRKTQSKHTIGILSWTTHQKPDILLEATFPDGNKITWIFDAKYRINSIDEESDLIPDDAINQMHRYRDALVAQGKSDDGFMRKTRPVIGAFVLYPGYFDEASGPNPYELPIEEVGIGGFPLLPGRENLWLKQFLTAKFKDFSIEPVTAPDADEHLLHESVRIAPSGLTLARYHDLTLAAMVVDRGTRYLQKFIDGTAVWYHMQHREIPEPEAIREIRFCALYAYDKSEKERWIEYIYDVRSIRIAKRSELTIEQAGRTDPNNDSRYWLIELGSSRKLPQRIHVPFSRRFRFRLTGKADLLRSAKWSDLPDRYQTLSGRNHSIICVSAKPHASQILGYPHIESIMEVTTPENTVPPLPE